MHRATRDHGVIIDLIALHHAMPALDRTTGQPRILVVDQEAPEAERVGWAPFFRALDAHALGVLPGEGGPQLIRWAERPRGAGWLHQLVEVARALPSLPHR